MNEYTFEFHQTKSVKARATVQADSYSEAREKVDGYSEDVDVVESTVTSNTATDSVPVSLPEGWIETDPDTGQWARPTPEGIVEVIERGSYYVFDVTQLTQDEINEIVKDYYGGGYVEIVEEYGIRWFMIVAEIMAEEMAATVYLDPPNATYRKADVTEKHLPESYKQPA